MIERQNTLNQLPSNDLADLNDNTIIVDEFVNSQNDFTANRFGSKFKTLQKIIADINKLSDEISVGALPATRIVDNEVSTYLVGGGVNFEKTPMVNGKPVITDLTDVDNKIELNKTKIGDFRLMPFRANELPFGWYFRNGDNYLLSSPQGKALNGLSNNYKHDHQITIKNINGQQYINVPSAFAHDGRGYFERAIDGTTRQVGTIEGDAIRNIYGAFYPISETFGAEGDATGVFQKAECFSNHTPASTDRGQADGVVFDASRIVPTANENRPINIGLTPAIYLGV